MTKINDLTQGSISKGIWSMAIPLITASFVQMAYNMTDMIWLGHLGSESVAAVGVAGFFTWLGNALSFISKVGAEVTISQSLGARAGRRARAYANQPCCQPSLPWDTLALFISQPPCWSGYFIWKRTSRNWPSCICAWSPPACSSRSITTRIAGYITGKETVKPR